MSNTMIYPGTPVLNSRIGPGSWVIFPIAAALPGADFVPTWLGGLGVNVLGVILIGLSNGDGLPLWWLSYGYGSIPINTIFRGMNIHLPAILMFTRGTRFWHTAIYYHDIIKKLLGVSWCWGLWTMTITHESYECLLLFTKKPELHGMGWERLFFMDQMTLQKWLA